MRGRGLALAAGYRMGQRQVEEQAAQQQMAPQAQAAPAAAPAAAPPTEDLTAKIERLAELHQSGALTDEEFAAAKKKILG
jgi:membrane protease subunit (stomatin/prohibitin family)